MYRYWHKLSVQKLKMAIENIHFIVTFGYMHVLVKEMYTYLHMTSWKNKASRTYKWMSQSIIRINKEELKRIHSLLHLRKKSFKMVHLPHFPRSKPKVCSSQWILIPHYHQVVKPTNLIYNTHHFKSNRRKVNINFEIIVNNTWQNGAHDSWGTYTLWQRLKIFNRFPAVLA